MNKFPFPRVPVGLLARVLAVTLIIPLVLTTKAATNEPVKGVSVSLETQHTAWTVGNAVHLNASARNQGTQEFMAGPTAAFGELEVDGVSYHWSDSLGIHLAPFQPGSQMTNIAVSLDRTWQSTNGQPLTLDIGKHTVRFVFTPDVTTGEPQHPSRKTRVLSNPVEIKIESDVRNSADFFRKYLPGCSILPNYPINRHILQTPNSETIDLESIRQSWKGPATMTNVDSFEARLFLAPDWESVRWENDALTAVLPALNLKVANAQDAQKAGRMISFLAHGEWFGSDEWLYNATPLRDGWLVTPEYIGAQSLMDLEHAETAGPLNRNMSANENARRSGPAWKGSGSLELTVNAGQITKVVQRSDMFSRYKNAQNPRSTEAIRALANPSSLAESMAKYLSGYTLKINLARINDRNTAIEILVTPKGQEIVLNSMREWIGVLPGTNGSVFQLFTRNEKLSALLPSMKIKIANEEEAKEVAQMLMDLFSPARANSKDWKIKSLEHTEAAWVVEWDYKEPANVNIGGHEPLDMIMKDGLLIDAQKRFPYFREQKESAPSNSATTNQSASPSAAAWGESVQGAAARLHAERTKWSTNEVPRLSVDLKNEGTRKLYVHQFQGTWEVEVDGIWHSWHGLKYTSPASDFSTGREYGGLALRLFSEWNKARQPETKRPAQSIPLSLPTGRHTVRVRVSLSDYLEGSRQIIPGDYSPVYVISNPQEIEILAETQQLAGIDAPWGSPVDGVAVSLQAERFDWDVDEPVIFLASLKNQGTKPFTAAQSQEIGELEVDGAWYHWGGRIDVKSSSLQSGSQFNGIGVELGAHWQNGKDKLALGATRHTVRFAFPEGNQPERKVISNPVEIILNASEQTALLHKYLPKYTVQTERLQTNNEEHTIQVLATPDGRKIQITEPKPKGGFYLSPLVINHSTNWVIGRNERLAAMLPSLKIHVATEQESKDVARLLLQFISASLDPESYALLSERTETGWLVTPTFVGPPDSQENALGKGPLELTVKDGLLTGIEQQDLFVNRMLNSNSLKPSK